MPDFNPSDLTAKDQMPSGLSWHMFTFLLIVFVVTVLGYFGLEFGYKRFLNSQIKELDAQIAISTSGREAEGEKNLVDFYSRVSNVKSLMEAHPIASKVFAFLESATNVKVVYNSVGFSTSQREITLDGAAASRSVLASQLLAYESYDGVSKVQLQSDTQSGSAVKFRARIILDPKFFTNQQL